MNSILPSQDAENRFTAYGEGYVCVNGVRYTSNLVVFTNRIITDWTLSTFTTLSDKDFELLAGLDAEVLLLGTGNIQRFPAQGLLQPLVIRQRTLEIMNTPSACRTFNMLAEQCRHVAAAILVA